MGALVAFESSARHKSFTRAAAELNLTQGAVSRQIRQLEDQLGLRLFERVRQRVVLTDAGRQYMKEVETALDALGEATHRLMAQGGSAAILKLAVLPTFGTRWLVPRLAGFIHADADVAISMATRISPFDFEMEPFDVAIHYGTPTWAGTVAHRLMEEEMVPVAAPAYAKRMRIRKPSDLNSVVLLHQTTRPTAWSDWFESVGVKAPDAFRGPLFEHFAMVAQAAVAELGVALVPKFLVEEELAHKRLKTLFEHGLRSSKAYYLIVPETKVDLPIVKKFTEWILVEAARSLKA